MLITKKALYYIKNNKIVEVDLPKNIILNDSCILKNYNNVYYIMCSIKNNLYIYKYTCENNIFTCYYNRDNILYYSGFDPKKEIVFLVECDNPKLLKLEHIDTGIIKEVHCFDSEIIELFSNEFEIIAAKTVNQFSNLYCNIGRLILCVEYDITDKFKDLFKDKLTETEYYDTISTNKIELVNDNFDIVVKYGTNTIKLKNKSFDHIYKLQNIILCYNNNINYVFMLNSKMELCIDQLNLYILKCKIFNNHIIITDYNKNIICLNDNLEITYIGNYINNVIINDYIWILENEKVVACYDKDMKKLTIN